MRYVQPSVHLIAEPMIRWGELEDYLRSRGADAWYERALRDSGPSDAEVLVEAAGRICYRSWEPGLNPNVTKVREDKQEYFENIMASAHGSVLEHAQFTFVLGNVSRVLTHELVRHRAGTAVSQESMRFVRFNDIPFHMPYKILDDQYEYVQEEIEKYIEDGKKLQKMMAAFFDIDNPDMKFKEKKELTSFMRRLLPEGVTTDIMWSANVRTLRHVIDKRTDPSAEEEIRTVFGMVFESVNERAPMLFADFENDNGHYKPKYRKV